MSQIITTQDFTEIADIQENIVVLTNGGASIIVEIFSTNFALLSEDEQTSKIVGFSSFLNSLTFPLQILVINKRVDISNYITLLSNEAHNAQNPQAQAYISAYTRFVQNLVKDNIVLDKRFFAVINYSSLESGVIGTLDPKEVIKRAKSSLLSKAQSVQSLLTRMNFQSKVLTDEALVILFKSMYTL